MAGLLRAVNGLARYVILIHMDPVSETQFHQFESLVRKDLASFFDGSGPIVCARAPGRLDVMGGVADYSGGVVLEATLAEATFAAAQEDASGNIILIPSLRANVGASSRASLALCIE